MSSLGRASGVTAATQRGSLPAYLAVILIVAIAFRSLVAPLLALVTAESALLGLLSGLIGALGDWVLTAAYNDRTLMRNALAYETARSIGRYAARTRFVELVILIHQLPTPTCSRNE